VLLPTCGRSAVMLVRLPTIRPRISLLAYLQAFFESTSPRTRKQNLRTLVLELYGREFEERLKSSSFPEVKSLELVHLLHYDRNELAGIWRISPNDSSWDPEETFRKDRLTAEVKLLEQQEDGSSIIFMRRLAHAHIDGKGSTLFSHDNVMGGGGYLLGLSDYDGHRLRAKFAGSQGYVKKILREIESRGVQYKILSVSDSEFGPDSLLYRLTDKQRKALLLAYQLGYYDVPRRIESEELARRLKVTRATAVDHLRKAERRLLRQIVGY